MCDVFFFGTARKTDSHTSERDEGKVMEIEGHATAERKPKGATWGNARGSGARRRRAMV